VDTAVKLTLGPVERANRITVKVEEYRDEKGEATWPHSQFAADVLRASFIISLVGGMIRVWASLLASPDFDMVRLKNEIGKCKKPYNNLHVNLVDKPAECEDPILSEAQFYAKAVFDLQHRRHLARELRRVTGVDPQISRKRASLHLGGSS
jgi:hypothetical protein